MTFDPAATLNADTGIFGLPVTRDQAAMVIVPVPWEVTTSYGGGTSSGPAAIRQASVQLDLFDRKLGKAYQQGLFMEEPDSELDALGVRARIKARSVMDALEGGQQLEEPLLAHLNEVNQSCEEMNLWVYEKAHEVLTDEKFLAIVGGDHSVPLGAIRAISENLAGEFGILHVDAHADLREAYQGFAHSHASIIHNVMTADWHPDKLVQVGIRDFCEEEFEFQQSHADQISCFYDADIKDHLFSGGSWESLCDRIVQALPQQVYVSFDIDGLSPAFCPHTGTPVPGGLDFSQAVYLIGKVVGSGRKLVGFDLVEVAPSQNSQNEWDANVGARLLFQLASWLLVSQGVGN